MIRKKAKPVITRRQRLSQAEKLTFVIEFLEVAVLETKTATPKEIQKTLMDTVEVIQDVNKFLSSCDGGETTSDMLSVEGLKTNKKTIPKFDDFHDALGCYQIGINILSKYRAVFNSGDDNTTTVKCSWVSIADYNTLKNNEWRFYCAAPNQETWVFDGANFALPEQLRAESATSVALTKGYPDSGVRIS